MVPPAFAIYQDSLLWALTGVPGFFTKDRRAITPCRSDYPLERVDGVEFTGRLPSRTTGGSLGGITVTELRASLGI